MTVCCLSSQLMTKLNTWRNLEGAEGNWTINSPSFSHLRHIRVVTAQALLPWIGLLATIESIAYGCLGMAKLCCTKDPAEHHFKYLESSFYTMYWVFQNFWVYNLIFPNVQTLESFARVHYDEGCFPIFARREDYDFIEEYENSHIYQPIINTIKELDRHIPDFITDLQSCHIEDMTLITANVIYHMAANTKSIPTHFSPTTRSLIQNMRSKTKLQEHRQAIEQILHNRELFQQDPDTIENPDVKAIMHQINGAIQCEIHSPFITKILPEVYKKFKETSG